MIEIIIFLVGLKEHHEGVGKYIAVNVMKCTVSAYAPTLK
jgi:hypothetical protein